MLCVTGSSCGALVMFISLMACTLRSGVLPCTYLSMWMNSILLNNYVSVLVHVSALCFLQYAEFAIEDGRFFLLEVGKLSARIL